MIDDDKAFFDWLAGLSPAEKEHGKNHGGDLLFGFKAGRDTLRQRLDESEDVIKTFKADLEKSTNRSVAKIEDGTLFLTSSFKIILTPGLVRANTYLKKWEIE